jgi:hypothetical protein
MSDISDVSAVKSRRKLLAFSAEMNTMMKCNGNDGEYNRTFVFVTFVSTSTKKDDGDCSDDDDDEDGAQWHHDEGLLVEGLTVPVHYVQRFYGTYVYTRREIQNSRHTLMMERSVRRLLPVYPLVGNLRMHSVDPASL